MQVATQLYAVFFKYNHCTKQYNPGLDFEKTVQSETSFLGQIVLFFVILCENCENVRILVKNLNKMCQKPKKFRLRR